MPRKYTKHFDVENTPKGVEVTATLAVLHGARGMQITLPTSWMQYLKPDGLIKTYVGELILATRPSKSRKLLITRKNTDFIGWDESEVLDVKVTLLIGHDIIWIEPVDYA